MRKGPLIVLTVVLLFLAVPGSTQSATPKHAQVKTLKVTILSTMLADEGIGEWGFAALVESDGHRILVDTGARPETVLSNIHDLNLDLSDVKEVILTHNHDDHVGGLLTLRREFMKKNPDALSIAHVGKGIFYSRPENDGKEGNPMPAIRKDFESTGGHFIEHDQPVEIFPGAWLTGFLFRAHIQSAIGR
jgi:7,8-dihydropterin-6-yl-methyl-4-(beta-D-ribofuranosyl)aminobenzene 5'-phosphate synthase